MKAAFRVHRGLVAPLPRRDIDTDQIVPKQFLKRLEKTGFGAHLFHDWRVAADGSRHPSFVLNQPRYAAASILVTGANFGCGSSREHAAWALLDYGIRVVIAPSFADIFRGNAVVNGLVPVILGEEAVSVVTARATGHAGYQVTVDLESCQVRDDQGLATAFDIDAASRHRLLEGLDDIALVLQHEEAISRYERASISSVPP